MEMSTGYLEGEPDLSLFLVQVLLEVDGQVVDPILELVEFQPTVLVEMQAVPGPFYQQLLDQSLGFVVETVGLDVLLCSQQGLVDVHPRTHFEVVLLDDLVGLDGSRSECFLR
jgi:hypothetical protein